MSYLYWLLGLDLVEQEEADERQKRQRHLLLKQIKNSEIILKPLLKRQVNGKFIKPFIEIPNSNLNTFKRRKRKKK